MTRGGIDADRLQTTVKTAMRMLGNAIDINLYTVPEARFSNLRHRPVGLGIMGFQDALYTLRIPNASAEAVQFADESMELIAFHAIASSVDLAAERGRYSSFEGSLWSRGILQHLRRRAVHQAHLPEPVCEVEHVRRLHRSERGSDS